MATPPQQMVYGQSHPVVSFASQPAPSLVPEGWQTPTVSARKDPQNFRRHRKQNFFVNERRKLSIEERRLLVLKRAEEDSKISAKNAIVSEAGTGSTVEKKDKQLAGFEDNLLFLQRKRQPVSNLPPAEQLFRESPPSLVATSSLRSSPSPPSNRALSKDQLSEAAPDLSPLSHLAAQRKTEVAAPEVPRATATTTDSVSEGDIQMVSINIGGKKINPEDHDSFLNAGYKKKTIQRINITYTSSSGVDETADVITGYDTDLYAKMVEQEAQQSAVNAQAETGGYETEENFNHPLCDDLHSGYSIDREQEVPGDDEDEDEDDGDGDEDEDDNDDDDDDIDNDDDDDMVNKENKVRKDIQTHSSDCKMTSSDQFQMSHPQQFPKSNQSILDGYLVTPASETEKQPSSPRDTSNSQLTPEKRIGKHCSCNKKSSRRNLQKDEEQTASDGVCTKEANPKKDRSKMNPLIRMASRTLFSGLVYNKDTQTFTVLSDDSDDKKQNSEAPLTSAYFDPNSSESPFSSSSSSSPSSSCSSPSSSSETIVPAYFPLVEKEPTDDLHALAPPFYSLEGSTNSSPEDAYLFSTSAQSSTTNNFDSLLFVSPSLGNTIGSSDGTEPQLLPPSPPLNSVPDFSGVDSTVPKEKDDTFQPSGAYKKLDLRLAANTMLPSMRKTSQPQPASVPILSSGPATLQSNESVPTNEPNDRVSENETEKTEPSISILSGDHLMARHQKAQFSGNRFRSNCLSFVDDSPKDKESRRFSSPVLGANIIRRQILQMHDGTPIPSLKENSSLITSSVCTSEERDSSVSGIKSCSSGAALRPKPEVSEWLQDPEPLKSSVLRSSTITTSSLPSSTVAAHIHQRKSRKPERLSMILSKPKKSKALGMINSLIKEKQPSKLSPRHTPQESSKVVEVRLKEPTFISLTRETGNLLDPFDLEDSDDETDIVDENLLRSKTRKQSSVEQSNQVTSDWNQRFIFTINKIRDFSIKTSIQTRIQANAELLHLGQDFLYCARTYGRIIISERYLPKSQKTIKPISIGGAAGGEKYIVHNVLFKFAVASNGILDSDYAAMKQAGNELKGLLSYFNCGIRELNFPLMALVDYMGFRLIAMSLLPINKNTLSYGTNNGGIQIHNSNPELSFCMKKAAQQLNLKSHICGLKTTGGRRLNGWKELHSAADIEGHLGMDNQFYLLDFSRTMPPEYPVKSKKGAHLYQLLRPEFVRFYHIPLCPDAFSGFQLADASSLRYNTEIQEATEFLHKIVIPQFARDSLVWQIIEAAEVGTLGKFGLTEAIHAKGINMRHIGILFSHVRDEAKFDVVRALLLSEAIARVIKNRLRLKLRRKIKEIGKPLETPFRSMIIRFLNLIFGRSIESTRFWETKLRKNLVKYFQINILETDDFPLKATLINLESNIKDFFPFGKTFLRLIELTGLNFSSLGKRKFETTERMRVLFQETHPFDDGDLEEISERVKHMNIVTQSLGLYYHYKGIDKRLEEKPKEATELFQLAIAKYEEALASNPTSKDLLYNCANCWTSLCELELSGGNYIGDVRFSLKDNKIQKTDQYYIRAVDSDSSDPVILNCYAKFLWRCGRLERAEEYFLQALEANPNYSWGLKDYGNFLSERGLEDDAEEFYTHASKKIKLQNMDEIIIGCRSIV